MYPSIDLDDAESHLGADTYRRGLAYAREGRVVRCLWNPGDDNLTGSVRGNRGRTYTTTAQLSMDYADSWCLEIGLCTCPMQVDCKHVAAILIAASGTTKTRSQRPSALPPAPSPWRTSLDALFPTSSPGSVVGTPLAIELNLSASGLDARVVRPGKRGGWVAADLSWGRLAALRHYGYPDAHIQVLQEFYAAYRTSAPNSTGYYSYSYTSYGDVKTISLLKFESPQLWPLLDEVRRVGVRLVQAQDHHDVLPYASARLSLDVTADPSGNLTVMPLLEVDGAAAQAVAFIGSSGHGVVCSDGGLRLARMDQPVSVTLQRMTLGDQILTIPAAEAAQFTAEYYPKLRHIAAITSSDSSFTPPTITGPTLVLRADYRGEHEVELTLQWAYRVGDSEFRVGVDASGDRGYRDPDTENGLARGIDAPLERFGLRAPDGRLIARAQLCGLETMRFTTELQPLLTGLSDVMLEVTGDPVDYREAGESLVIGVATNAVPGQTD